MSERALRLAYADPPYPGRAHLYKDQASYGGEVNHLRLVEHLATFDGWALSTNSDSLAYVLSLCPRHVRIAAWVRTNAMPFNADGRGSVRSWEPVIYMPAREERFAPDRVRDVLSAGIPQGVTYKGLTGAKPDSFAAWVFALLGARHGDSLSDVFPGTGTISEAWKRWNEQPTLFAAALGGPRSGEHYREPTEPLPAAPTGDNEGGAV